jgi:ABC-type polysaccharide/polyol phosphate transport system ATPase subunit
VKDARIFFDRVWKKFHRGEMHDSLRDLIPAAARRLVGRGPDLSELSQGDFWAVKDLSFEVLPGQTLGIIGPNGSGKSTTLKLLTRILEPTRGYCELRGRAGMLIEVSAGFHGDLTGRENVFLQGAIMGMRSADIARKFDEIVEFSGVADSIDTPVKRYSSGMNARLGFSIAAHLEPDVLIIDEVLAVGDMSFQERAFGRIRDLARSGIPVVMVSHQLDRIAELCTDAILLNRGEVVSRGTAADAIASYVRQHDAARAVAGTGLVAFDSVRLLDDVVRSGQRCCVRIDGRISDPVPDSVEPLHARVRSLRSGNLLYQSGSRRLGLDLTQAGPFSAQLELQANLPPGNYMIEVAAQDLLNQKDIASAPSVMLRVTDPGSFAGQIQLNGALSLLS